MLKNLRKLRHFQTPLSKNAFLQRIHRARLGLLTAHPRPVQCKLWLLHPSKQAAAAAATTRVFSFINFIFTQFIPSPAGRPAVESSPQPAFRCTHSDCRKIATDVLRPTLRGWLVCLFLFAFFVSSCSTNWIVCSGLRGSALVFVFVLVFFLCGGGAFFVGVIPLACYDRRKKMKKKNVKRGCCTSDARRRRRLDLK